MYSYKKIGWLLWLTSDDAYGSEAVIFLYVVAK